MKQSYKPIPTTLFNILCALVILFSGTNLFAGTNQDENPKAEFEVLVFDFDNNSLAGEQIWFSGKESGKVFKGVSNGEGKFAIKIDAGDTYEIQIKSIGEAQVYNTVKIPAIGPDEFFPPSTLRIKIRPAEEFTLDNVYFDSGKWDLKKESEAELNELFNFMKYKKHVRVQINGHTDNIGEAEANKTLSKNRAEAVVAYLVDKGINPKRIRAVGYGEERPRDTNSTSEGRANNRRTEVKVFGNK